MTISQDLKKKLLAYIDRRFVSMEPPLDGFKNALVRGVIGHDRVGIDRLLMLMEEDLRPSRKKDSEKRIALNEIFLALKEAVRETTAS